MLRVGVRRPRLRPSTAAGGAAFLIAVALSLAPTASGDDPPPAVQACLDTKFKEAGRPLSDAEVDKLAEACFQSVAGIPPKSGTKPPSSTADGKAPAVGKAAASGGCPTPAALLKAALAAVNEPPTPTAAEIACNAKKAKRLVLPRVIVSSEIPGNPWNNPELAKFSRSPRGGAVAFAARLRMVREGYPSDIGLVRSTALPPYGADVTQPALMPAHLRMYQAAVLADKADGRPVIFEIPIAGPAEQWEHLMPKDEQGFRRWLERVVTPRVAAQARAAEQVKAEAFVVPFELEPDVLLNAGPLRELPADVRVDLAQALVTTGLRTARKHFKGLVIGHRGWQFHAPTGEGAAFWGAARMERVSYRGYDIVISTFFPVLKERCDAVYVREYMAIQLGKTIELARRDGVRWGVGEVDVFTLGRIIDYAGCGTGAPRATFMPLMGVALGALLGAPERPAWVRLTGGPDEWQADAAFRTRLGKRLAAFARKLKAG